MAEHPFSYKSPILMANENLGFESGATISFCVFDRGAHGLHFARVRTGIPSSTLHDLPMAVLIQHYIPRTVHGEPHRSFGHLETNERGAKLVPIGTSST
jgi:hypothetical protein